MKSLSALLAVLLIGAVLTGCGPDEVKSEKDRGDTDQAGTVDLVSFAEANGEFAFDLYRQLKNDEGNLFFSPYSISSALAMTFAGARGETETAMTNALHFPMPQENLHASFNALDTALASRGADSSDRFRLNIANAIWTQTGYKFHQVFLDVLAGNYGAGIKTVDFNKSAESARKTINNWVSDETNGKIKDLIPPGGIDPLTRLVLTNAIYFDARWESVFPDYGTNNRQFRLLDGTTVTVPFMSQTTQFNYSDRYSCQTIELLYEKAEFSMVIMVPDEGTFKSFEESLNHDRVSSIIKAFDIKKVHLAMPKFEFSSEFSLRKILNDMGMGIAFTPRADFSGITDQEALFIDEVIHEAYVAVDEDGTTAAAATAVMMTGSAPETIVTMTIDRPFIFLIRDVETGTILFIGRVMQPDA